MKKTLLFASAAVLLCGCGTGSKYVVEGHIAGLEGTVYMFEGDSLIDSAVVEGGKFRFEGPADITARRTVTDSREGDAQRFGTMFFPEPGTVSIEDNPDAPAGSTRVTGTPANDASSAFRASAMTLMDEYHREGTSEGRRREIEDELGGLPRKTAEANRDNAFGIMALEGMAPTLSGQELLDRIAEFSPGMQKSRELAALRTVAAQRLKTDIGQPYMNIMQGDADGQIVTLTSVIDNPANKYTLVDFWASWCGPCMEEVPHLKQAYDKFHGQGFEIYGVSLDNDNDKWLGAIREHGMGWVQVSDLNGFDNLAAKTFAAKSPNCSPSNPSCAGIPVRLRSGPPERFFAKSRNAPARKHEHGLTDIHRPEHHATPEIYSSMHIRDASDYRIFIRCGEVSHILKYRKKRLSLFRITKG